LKRLRWSGWLLAVVLIVQNAAVGQSAAMFTPTSLAHDDRQQNLRVDHYIPHTSTAPATKGEQVTLYMRERAQVEVVQETTPLTGKVVVFIQGSRFGSTGVFDAQYQDYSWMGYLAQSGFDTFGLDMTGYGFSTRPAPMDDPCNLEPAQQALIFPSVTDH
jgi:hypothetical protein